DGDPRGAGVDHLVEVLLGDAADGEPGERGRLGGPADEGEARQVGEVLGVAGEDRADAEVVRPGEDRGVELGAVVGRDADHGLGAQDAAGGAERDGVLGPGGAGGAGGPGGGGGGGVGGPGGGPGRGDGG